MKTVKGVEPILQAAEYGSTTPEVLDKMRRDNVRTWLEHEAMRLATEGQQSRYARGELPEDDILTIARAVLFKGFGDFERWATGRAHDQMVKALRHVVKCSASHDSDIELDTVFAESDALTEVEAENLRTLQACADGAKVHPWLVHTGGTVKVTWATHYVTCGSCGAEEGRSSGKVTITWGERELVREYAL